MTTYLYVSNEDFEYDDFGSERIVLRQKGNPHENRKKLPITRKDFKSAISEVKRLVDYERKIDEAASAYGSGYMVIMPTGADKIVEILEAITGCKDVIYTFCYDMDFGRDKSCDEMIHVYLEDKVVRFTLKNVDDLYDLLKWVYSGCIIDSKYFKRTDETEE